MGTEPDPGAAQPDGPDPGRDRLSEKLRIVTRVSASLHQLDPDELQDAVADAVLAVGFDGCVLVLADDSGLLQSRHGRGIFAGLEGAWFRQSHTVTAEVLADQRSRVVDDYPASPHAQPDVIRTGVRTVAAVPIRSSGEVLGVMHAGRSAVQPVSDDDREVLSLLADLAGTTLRNARSYLDLKRTSDRLAEELLRDPLTGLGNRRAAEHVLATTRPGDTLVVIDLDHFKQVNDTLGHAAGDRLLVDFARLLQSGIRERDHAARLGGEEFLLALPATTSPAAFALLARLRESWARDHDVTFSAGLAVTTAEETGEQAQQRADAALYAAKAAGRNRVRIAGPGQRNARPA